MRYPKERKEAVLKKMLPPNNNTIREIARKEGISEATLYNWRKAARAEGRLLPDGDSTPEGWSASDKFSAVVETAAMMRWSCRNTAAGGACIRPRSSNGVRPVSRPMIGIGARANGYPKPARRMRSGSRSWSGSFGRKRKPWLKRQPCWCCQKNSLASGGTRKNHQHPGSPPNFEAGRGSRIRGSQAHQGL